MLILHETGHYGDYKLDGVPQDGEPGFMIEFDVWLSKWIDVGGGETEQVQYLIDGKFDLGAALIIIDEKRDQGVLPTVPE